MESNFEYYAFISYKREDEKWAKWLQNKLEGYKLPAVIRKEVPRLPKRIRPIFRDKTDLGAGMLTESLRKELEKSRYLIVICSPQSAKSEWVGKEITTFVEIGRADSIIPFIVAGEPNCNNEQECFHPVIKEKIPDVLGINVNEIGKQQAFVKVAARLLDLRFDALWNRFLREQRKQRFIAAVIGLALLFGIGYVLDYNYHVKTYYYKDYVEQWGQPVGIGKLSESEFKHRTASYRFKKLKGKIIRVSHVNNKGNIVEHWDSEYTERYDDMLLSYNENGNINQVKRLDRNGKVLYIMHYDETLTTANFTYADAKTEITLSSSTTQLFTSAFYESNEKSYISKYLLTYDNNGYLIQLKYAGYRQSQVCDNEGIYGKEFAVDEKGRMIEEHYLGKDYTSKANKAGLAIKKLEYDKNGDLVKVSHFAANGEPSFDGNGCHIYAIEYDIYGNKKKETYYDKEGNVTLRTDGKIAGYNYVVENGFLIQLTTFGINKEICYVAKDELNENNDMFGYASSKYEYDANGYTNKIAFFDTEDKPVIISTGISITKFKNDSKGNPLIYEYFDTEDRSIENIYGYSKVIAEYDSVGNITSAFYWNTQGSLSLDTKGGIAGFRREFDKYGKLTKQTFFGTDNNPCESIDGVITVIQDYDKDENLKQVSFLSSDGKTLKLSNEGIAGWKSEYKDGYEIERTFFDAEGSLTAGNIGYARRTTKYDENGFPIEGAYFDKNGNPIAIYDPNKDLNIVFIYSKIEYIYDNEQRNKIEEILYNGNIRSQIIRYKYDNKYDYPIEISFFDGNGSAIINDNGWHKMTLAYNNQQQITEQRLYNSNGQPTLVHDQLGGFAILKNEYDQMGRISRQTYFGENEQPTPLHMPESLTGYDKQGNINYIASADGKGNIIYNPKVDFAYMEMKHDAKGNITEECFYNADKKLRQNNFAIARYKYNKIGRIIDCSMYNYLDKAADFFREWYIYGHEAHDVSETYLRYVRWHRSTIDYDEQGNLLFQKFYLSNNILVATYKYNKQTYKWDFITDWRQYWKKLIPNCPYPINYGVEGLSISLTGNGCDIVIRFTGISKHSMDDSEITTCENFGKQFAQYSKKESQMPSDAQLTVIGIDKDKKEIFRVTY